MEISWEQWLPQIDLAQYLPIIQEAASLEHILRSSDEETDTFLEGLCAHRTNGGRMLPGHKTKLGRYLKDFKAKIAMSVQQQQEKLHVSTVGTSNINAYDVPGTPMGPPPSLEQQQIPAGMFPQEGGELRSDLLDWVREQESALEHHQYQHQQHQHQHHEHQQQPEPQQGINADYTPSVDELMMNCIKMGVPIDELNELNSLSMRTNWAREQDLELERQRRDKEQRIEQEIRQETGEQWAEHQYEQYPSSQQQAKQYEYQSNQPQQPESQQQQRQVHGTPHNSAVPTPRTAQRTPANHVTPASRTQTPALSSMSRIEMAPGSAGENEITVGEVDQPWRGAAPPTTTQPWSTSRPGATQTRRSSPMKSKSQARAQNKTQQNMRYTHHSPRKGSSWRMQVQQQERQKQKHGQTMEPPDRVEQQAVATIESAIAVMKGLGREVPQQLQQSQQLQQPQQAQQPPQPPRKAQELLPQQPSTTKKKKKATPGYQQPQQRHTHEPQYVHPPNIGTSMRLANPRTSSPMKSPMADVSYGNHHHFKKSFDAAQHAERSQESEAALHSFFDMSWNKGGVRESANRFERRRRDCSFHVEPSKALTGNEKKVMGNVFRERLRLQTQKHAARKKTVDRRAADEQRAQVLRVKNGAAPKKQCKEKLGWRMKY
jgi:hypothetical protein